MLVVAATLGGITVHVDTRHVQTRHPPERRAWPAHHAVT